MFAPEFETDATKTDFDTDEEDFDENEDLSPLHIDWVDISHLGSPSQLIGMSSLPGCKFMQINRNLQHDIESLVQQEIKDVFVFCTEGELIRCRVGDILENYKNAGIMPHHFPLDDVEKPQFKTYFEIVQKLINCVKNKRKTLLHCVAGVGRTCLVAGLLLLDTDSEIQEESVIQRLKDLRGANAIQTVKQFNFINDYRESKNKFIMQPIQDSPISRSVSR